MKLYSITKPLKVKLEESLRKISELENQVKEDKIELDKIKQVFNLKLVINQDKLISYFKLTKDL